MPHLAGKKISGSHSSLIDAAVGVIDVAISLDCVSKVVLGLIKRVKGPATTKSIKIVNIPAGIKVRIRGPKSVQELFIYTSRRQRVTDIITAVFEK